MEPEKVYAINQAIIVEKQLANRQLEDQRKIYEKKIADLNDSWTKKLAQHLRDQEAQLKLRFDNELKANNEIFNQITYIPHINGFRLHDRGGGVRSESIEYKFPTLEDAKIQTMKQVDKTIEFAKDVRYVRISKD